MDNKGIRQDLERWSQSSPVTEDLTFLLTEMPGQEKLPVDRFSVMTASTPTIKPYIFTKDVRFDLWAWMQSEDPLYIFGPTGCGKSAMVEQLAARLRVPLFNLIGSFDTDVSDFYGSRTACNGTVFYEYGPLSLAYKYGGFFLLDELDGLNPALALGLNTVLDGRPLVIPETGEIIHRHPRFRFIATANTNGGSDDTGVYQGTNRLNLAFMDRFLKMEVAYLPEQIEVVLLMQHASDIRGIHGVMLKFANLVRKNFLNPDSTSQIDVTFSTRTLLRWANLIQVYKVRRKEIPNILEHTMMRAVGYMASEPCRIALKEILQRVAGGSADGGADDQTDE
jgi:cobaltochelatase CobS